MRPTFERILPADGTSWALSTSDVSHFGFAWHLHPEIELTGIVHGSGTRFVGDSVEEYGTGDTVLIGSDLPHSWMSAPNGPSQRAVVVQFRPDFLGPDFFRLPEFAAVRSLLDAAARGLAFPPSRAPELLALVGLPPPSRTLALLGVLVSLAADEAGRPLTSPTYAPPRSTTGSGPVDDVLRFLHSSYAEPISGADVARVACLSETSAGRLFNRWTGTTVTRYLNQVRVAAACRLLRETDEPVARVAAACGYRNLANFNRRFREIVNMAPREFRVAAHGLPPRS